DLNRLLIGKQPGGAQPVLYLLTSDPIAGTAQLLVSVDDGQNWTTMPSQRIADVLSISTSPIGVLADGSALAPFSHGGTAGGGTALACDAWAPGQSVVRAIGTPVPGVLDVALLVPAESGGPAALWAVYDSDSNRVTAWVAASP